MSSLPDPAGVPILGASARTDTEESLARLALFVSVIVDALGNEVGPAKANFIMAGAADILERYGPIDPEHEFGD